MDRLSLRGVRQSRAAAETIVQSNQSCTIRATNTASESQIGG